MVDVPKLSTALRLAVERHERLFPDLRTTEPARWQQGALRQSWWWISIAARDLVRWVVETRSIPADKARAVRLLARTFLSTDPPRGVVAEASPPARRAVRGAGLAYFQLLTRR